MVKVLFFQENKNISVHRKNVRLHSYYNKVLRTIDRILFRKELLIYYFHCENRTFPADIELTDEK